MDFKLAEAILVKHTKFQSSSFERQDPHFIPLAMLSQVYRNKMPRNKESD